jgi:hypothetical protein
MGSELVAESGVSQCEEEVGAAQAGGGAVETGAAEGQDGDSGFGR